MTGIGQINKEIPKEFMLHQNYPNPFNPFTKIKFDIPNGTRQNVFTQLKVFDILGREAVTLVSEQLNPGSYEVDWNASNFTSGIYYYKLKAGNYLEGKRMVLIK